MKLCGLFLPAQERIVYAVDLHGKLRGGSAQLAVFFHEPVERQRAADKCDAAALFIARVLEHLDQPDRRGV